MRRATRPRLALLASGQGSNAEAIIRAVQQGRLEADIALLVSDHRTAPALARASALDVAHHALEPGDYSDKAAYETALLQLLKQAQVDTVILAGYMRLVGATLLNAYPQRIINTHPSLLPRYPGLDAIGQALSDQARVTGITVHYVDAGMDTGPIIAQRHIPILQDDDHARLSARLKQIEHRFYPDILQSIFEQWRLME